MEAFFTYLLPFAVLSVILSLLFLNRKRNSSGLNLPPGSSGWPMVGENMEFVLQGPQKFVYERMNKYSPEQTSHFVVATIDEKALLFPEYADNSVKEVGALQRSFLHEILKPEALKQYIPLMDAMAREHVETEWAPCEEVKVFPLSKKYTFALACKLFMSVEDPDHVKRLADPFTLVTSGMFSVPIDLPGTAYNRAIKGGKMVREELLKIIRARRNELMESKETSDRDLLSRMLLITDEQGQFMNEMEISNNIIGLLVASYETTSTAVTFVLKYLAELPHIYSEVYKEQMEIAKSKGPDELLTWEDIQKMKYSWNVACEALRLSPPAQGAFRE
ncbi:unnamed protein product, partial [Ilex paraguariensis]